MPRQKYAYHSVNLWTQFTIVSYKRRNHEFHAPLPCPVGNQELSWKITNLYWEVPNGCRNLCYRPDGLKKAYVRLATDYDALDVANKVSNLLDKLSVVFFLDQPLRLTNGVIIEGGFDKGMCS